MTTASNEFVLTNDGVTMLKDELERLVKVDRPQIAEKLKEAKADGDLSENAAYDDARDKQGFVEGRISEIEHILKHARLITAKDVNQVSLGSTVHLELEDGTQQYTIVGPIEANPDKGMISDQSPLGRALIGKKAGEEINITVPSGTMTYKITKIA